MGDTSQVWHSEDPAVPHLKLREEHPKTINDIQVFTFKKCLQSQITDSYNDIINMLLNEKSAL